MTTILLTMSPEDAAKEMVDRAIRAGSTDNVTALCVWAAPVSVLDAPPAAAPAEARMNVLLTALVLLGLVIFIAIVGYIVLAT